MRLTQAQWDELIAHARDADPSECCGFMKVRDGEVHEVVRAESSKTWRYGFNFEFPDLMAMADAEDEGWEIAVYHSHPRSEAKPSQQDINAWGWPAYLCVIISLAGEPVVRAFTIDGGKFEERDVAVA